ncbi:FAD-dependent monooxygenase [Streptomyces monashensis]|uniref:NAD(P)/FAD-dependent oxidoreductase n=1 Tax=Streptomyces monashensis TaxID=1678012 RepID=UPI0033FD8C75
MSVEATAEGRGGGQGHAVVIGSGPAGLAAAGALAGFMDRVTVIERDPAARGPFRRRGVPQARHTHTLAAAARHGLEELFPGIVRDLTAAGAVRLRMSEDVLVLGPAGWLPRFDSGQSLLSASRDLIDAVLRDRLRADPRVTFRQEHEAVALEPGRHDAVAGVWTRGRDHKASPGSGPRRLIPADFVVDASGRTSRAPQWLAELGYQPPCETVFATGTTYASTLYAPPVGHVADWSALLLMGTPGDPRQGMLHPVEGGRWSVTLCAADGTPPPAGHAELLRAAAALRHPLLHDVIRTATPLGPVYGCHRLEHRWRHYEKLRRWPDRFLVVGDAFVTLDPAHGHGVTPAVESALVLGRLLSTHGTTAGLSHRLRRALAHQLAPAWQSSLRSAGAALPDRDGPSGLRARLGRRYAARLAAAATVDPHAAAVLLDRLQRAAVPPAGLPRHHAFGHDRSGATSPRNKRLEVHG